MTPAIVGIVVIAVLSALGGMVIGGGFEVFSACGSRTGRVILSALVILFGLCVLAIIASGTPKGHEAVSVTVEILTFAAAAYIGGMGIRALDL